MSTPTVILSDNFVGIVVSRWYQRGYVARGRARLNPLSDKELRRRSTTLPSNAATVKLDRRLEAVAVVRVPLCLDFHLATNPVTKHARRQCRDGCNRFADCPTVSVLRTAQLLPLFVGVDDCFGVSQLACHVLPLCVLRVVCPLL